MTTAAISSCTVQIPDDTIRTLVASVVCGDLHTAVELLECDVPLTEAFMLEGAATTVAKYRDASRGMRDLDRALVDVANGTDAGVTLPFSREHLMDELAAELRHLQTEMLGRSNPDDLPRLLAIHQRGNAYLASLEAEVG